MLTKSRRPTPVKIQTFRVSHGKTVVHNIRTRVEHGFALDAREAVIAAYAQEHGDFNTANYEARYGDRVHYSGLSWYLGDWAAVHR
jgi:hypothetical protein